jgi:multiple sugar transport system substrate-binding protein
MVAAVCASLLPACGGSSGPPTLHWFINPDNGGQEQLAERCAAASQGRYDIKVSLLPSDATGQREQLVRRLAADDSAIDLMSLDPPFVAEFAAAGFLRPFSEAEAEGLTAGVLDGPVESARWDGQLYSAPFWANSQLLWYRKSVAAAAGLDPAAEAVTWAQIIEAAEAQRVTVEVQARRYEGYMVLINALVASAGGTVVDHPERGRDAEAAIDSPAGRRAASVIARLARSRAANPSISTSDEEVSRTAFQRDSGGFLVNWPYVYGAAADAVKAGSLQQEVFDDIGWARYPQVEEGQASRPPLGGINLAVGAFSRHPELAVEAVGCITSEESQRQYMVEAKNPAARSAVYDDPEVREIFPMADLIRTSIDEAAPRPQTPYYVDISTAIVRTFHPPTSVREATPAKAASLMLDVLDDRALL